MIFEFFAVGLIAFFVMFFTLILVWCGTRPHKEMGNQSGWFGIFAFICLITMIVFIEGLL